MKNILQLIAFLLFCSHTVIAQIGIGTTLPDPSSILDLSSTNKGLLVPRMTSTQRTNITSPATGLLVFQTDGIEGFYYYDGLDWIYQDPLGDNLGDHSAIQNILLQGYYLSNDGDDEGIFVDAVGKIGISTTNPTADLHIHQPSNNYSTIRLTHNASSTFGAILENNSFGVNLINYDNLPLFFGTNGNNRMVINNTGLVGIGTTNPFYTLHLRKGTFGPSTFLQHGDWVTNAGDTLAIIRVGDAQVSQDQAAIVFQRDMISSNSNDLPTSISFWITKDGNSTISRAMTITNSGEVGIGTATPSTRLDVSPGIINAGGYRISGSAPVGSYLRGNGTSFVSSPISAGDIPSGSIFYINNQFFSDQTANFRITNNSLNTAIIRSTSTTTNSAALLVENTSTTANATYAISATVASSNTNTAAIKGVATGTTADVTGVWGESSSATTFSSGVYGRQTGAGQTYGVYGRNTGNGTNSAGVRGFSDATTATAWGVQGVANSSNTSSAGVYGLHNHNSAAVSGVIGEVTSNHPNAAGVYGKAPNTGFGGYFQGKGYFSGYLGLGTNAPNTPFEISSNVSWVSRVQSSSNIGTWYSVHNSSTGGVWFHLINTGASNGEGVGKFMIIRGTGAGSTTGNPSIIVQHNNNNVGINTANPDQALSVNGNASKTGGGTWATFSDKRLKTHITHFNRGLKDLLQIQPVFYEYKKDNPLGIVSDGVHTGFIAQDVEKIIPEAIIYNKNHEYLSLNHDPILWTMLNAVKDLNTIKVDKTEMEELKQENQNLKIEIQNLKNQLNELEKSVKKLESNLLAK